MTGSYKDLKFTKELEGCIDYGSAYAQKTIEDCKGRRIWWGWVNEGSGRGQDAGWSSALSLPRILTLRDDGLLNIDPVPELNSLRATRHAVEKLTVTESSPLLLKDIKGDCTEIVAEIDPGTVTQVGIRVRSTADGSEQTLIGYDSTDKMLFSDTTKSTANRPAARSGRGAEGGRGGSGNRRGNLILAEKEPLRLHIFLDASVIETFANSRTGIIDRVYPSSPEALGIGLFAKGGSAVVHSFETWELKPISNDRLTLGPLM
jgi:beta-fructofuranosidase